MTELSEARARAEAALIEGDLAAEVGAPVTWGEVRALQDVIRALLAASAPVEGDEREAPAHDHDALMRELHHFEVEQQLAETIETVKRARAAVRPNEHTPASWQMDKILDEIDYTIPEGGRRPSTPTDGVSEGMERAVRTVAQIAQSTGMSPAEVVSTVKSIGGSPTEEDVERAREALTRLADQVINTAGRRLSDLGPSDQHDEGLRRAHEDIAAVRAALSAVHPEVTQ